MPDPYVVKPDRDFLYRILDEGGEDLKKCFQCATCSVVCELSEGKSPFPRKEMIWTQWGLKDRLVADPDVWLCHQCNDCSTKCPRGARPGDVLAAVRHETVKHYAVPRVMGKLVGEVKFLPILLIVPAVLLLLALALKGPIWGALEPVLHYMHHDGFYSDLYPHWLLIGFFTTFWGLGMLGGLLGLLRFWGAMKAADEAAGRYEPVLGIVPSLVRVVMSIFRHDKFSKCGGRETRRWAHLGAFYGFAALFIVSVWAVIALYMINPVIPGHDNDLHYPFGFDIFGFPWKLLANLGAMALIGGCVLAIRERTSGKEESGTSTNFDWVFVWLLLIVGVSGLLTQILRWVVAPDYVADGGAWTAPEYLAYAIYFVHLVVVFGLLVYLPYSKFAHVLYRTAALVYAEHSGRSAAVTESEPVAKSEPATENESEEKEE